MGAALREAWLWILLTFIFGLVIGYFLKRWTARERRTTDSTTTRIAQLEAQLDEYRATSKGAAEVAPGKAPAPRKSTGKAAPLDLAAGKAVLDITVKLDDLKLIEGIGPRIETLFKADGITTWRALSKANVEWLQGVLDAAGPRYKMHNPASWPRQAVLLADGKWAEFKALTDNLKDGQ